jgi:hypothetical protein
MDLDALTTVAAAVIGACAAGLAFLFTRFPPGTPLRD